MKFEVPVPPMQRPQLAIAAASAAGRMKGIDSELVAAVDNWMNFYNTRRKHSAIGMLSPPHLRKITGRANHGRLTALSRC